MNDSVLFINAQYYKENIPTDRSIDEAKLTSIIKGIQLTLVQDVLSDALYDHIYQKIDNGDPLEADEQKLFDYVQLFMAYASARDYATVSMEAGESRGDTQYSVYTSKIRITRARIKEIINKSSTLSAIAESSEDLTYKSEPRNNSGGFFFV